MATTPTTGYYPTRSTLRAAIRRLRGEGASWPAVAAATGVSKSTAKTVFDEPEERARSIDTMPRKPEFQKCVCCERSIPRKVTRWTILTPTNLFPEGTVRADVVATTIYTHQKARTPADLTQFTGDHVLRLWRGRKGFVHTFTTWDGETYEDEFFCSRRCAIELGYRYAKELQHAA
jgi:hypothetical protein